MLGGRARFGWSRGARLGRLGADNAVFEWGLSGWRVQKGARDARGILRSLDRGSGREEIESLEAVLRRLRGVVQAPADFGGREALRRQLGHPPVAREGGLMCGGIGLGLAGGG